VLLGREKEVSGGHCGGGAGKGGAGGRESLRARVLGFNASLIS
jgi:hypothetical protein